MLRSTGCSALILTVFLLISFSQVSSAKHMKTRPRDSIELEARSSNLSTSSSAPILIKLALFVDNSLNRHLKYDLMLNGTEIRELLHGYVRQIDSLFSTLRSDSISRIHVSLVEIRFEQRGFHGELHGGDIDSLLSDFCLYQNSERKLAPIGWDLAMLLTSMDLYSSEEVETSSMAASSTTMGISPVQGINWPELSCSIVEFGLGYETDQLNDTVQHRVYPSRGFGSAWVAAHEIAHSLGIHHDGPPFNSACHSDQWIMSSGSHISSMSSTWSPCSIESIEMLDLSKFAIEDGSSIGKTALPGRRFDAEFQCKMFSNKLHKSPLNSGSICNETLWCSTLHDELVPVGPALAGTWCENQDKICLESRCVPLAT